MSNLFFWGEFAFSHLLQPSSFIFIHTTPFFSVITNFKRVNQNELHFDLPS